MMRPLVATAAAALAVAVSAGIAHADPASDNDQYDQYMISHGVDGDLLQLGYAQCAGLRAGSSEQVLIGQLEHQMSWATSNAIVYAAHRYLCADA
jgi:hypothetical protein